jgi:hypothetical protein
MSRAMRRRLDGLISPKRPTSSSETEFLMNHGDAGQARPKRTRKRGFDARKPDQPAVRTDRAAQNLHNRRLPRPVLPDQGMNVARVQVKRYGSQRLHAGIGLHNIDELESRAPLHRHSRRLNG